MFKGDNATAQVSRLVYVDGKTNGRSVVGSYVGYLTDIGINEITDPKLYGKLFHFNTQYGADIKDSDDITIGSDKYSVQRVFHKKGCTLSFTRCILLSDA